MRKYIQCSEVDVIFMIFRCV